MGNVMDAILPLDGQAPEAVGNEAPRDPIAKRFVKAAGFLILSGVGLFIGAALGLIAALLLGLIGIC